MSSFASSSDSLSFNSTFAGIPVVIEYEVEVNEDHRGRDVAIIPTVCLIGESGVDLCEDAGFFHPEQLKKWLTQAEGHYGSLLADDSEPDDDADPWAASAAEDRWIAERERIHHQYEARWEGRDSLLPGHPPRGTVHAPFNAHGSNHN